MLGARAPICIIIPCMFQQIPRNFHMFDGLKNSLSYYFNDIPGRLTEAAAANNRAEADRLLDKYTSVARNMIDTPSVAGQTALMTASINGHADMAKHLVSRGA